MTIQEARKIAYSRRGVYPEKQVRHAKRLLRRNFLRKFPKKSLIIKS